MRQDRNFRKNFRTHFVLMGILLAGITIAAIIAWAPWS